MAMVDRLATESLPRLLFERLEEAVLEEETSKRLDFLYRAATGCLTSRKREYKHRLDLDADGIEERVVFKTVSGREVTLKEIRGATRKGRRFLIETGESPLTRALQAAGELVLEVNSNGAAYQFLRALHREKELVYAPAKYCLPVPARSDEETRRWEPLRRALTRLIESYGGKLRGVELAHFRYKGSGIGGRVAITQESLGELTLRSEIQDLGTGFFSQRRVLVINADHPLVVRLATLAENEPELAAYILAKLFFLRGTLTTRIDARLTELSLEGRCRRLAS